LDFITWIFTLFLQFSLTTLIVSQNAFSPDSQIAWGLIKIKEDLPPDETYDEWYPLTGKQGDDKEGMINVVMSVTVSISITCLTKSTF
jgi:hypothetical protein